MRTLRLGVLVLAVACGCAPRPRAPFGPWITSVRASSPLVGRTWDARRRVFVPFDRAEAAAARARFVLLGEKHDNADHHRLQAEALRRIASSGGPRTVVFEMIDVDLQPAIDAYLATGRATVDGLRGILQWDTRGWPAWRLYRPIFDAAIGARLKIVAGGLTHDMILRLVHEGVSALPPEVASRARVPPLPPALAASLDRQIKASHCGFLPDSLIAPMSLAQRVKDAFMADLMASQPGGAVLVAGNGHVRTDRGVPFELAALAPGAAIVSVSFVEVGPSADPATYAADEPADFLVFTPRVDDADPCVKFRARR
jgi:uncharacterized iron-regulated protein